MKTAGIIGASGYTGYELIKLLTKHKDIELKILNSRTYEGKKVCELYNDFFDKNLKFTNYSIEETNNIAPNVLFLATPNGKAMETVPKLNKKIKVIDLSADYRFKDKAVYENIYGITHSDKERKAVYGLPEIFKEKIKKARLVANPGCYVTACILASYPIQKLAKYIVFDCKSGWSGAGMLSDYAKDPGIIKDNLMAYKLTKHRHKYEINQFIKGKISFTPHVIDTFRGMMCTAHILLKKEISVEEIKNIFKNFYKEQPFIRITDKIPQIRGTQKNNYCNIGGFEIDENNQLIIVSTIDNLIKGASGQAVQNMNLMLGFDEREGLSQ